MSQSRNWCFTLNNYTDDDVIMFDNLQCSYIVYGKEVGESGTPHLQGFIIFHANRRLASCKKVHAGAHWATAKGSSLQASDYCKKDKQFTERGELPITKKRQGEIEKERWSEMRKAAEDGRYDDIEDKSYCKNPKAFHFIHEQALKKRKLPTIDGELSNEWLTGESGTGKSMTARAENPDAYIKQATKWWDGYEAQQVVIMEDLDTGHEWLAYSLNQWADRYPFPAEVKGSSLGNIRPQKIVVTSRYLPDQIFKDSSTINSINRRFKFRHFPDNK